MLSHVLIDAAERLQDEIDGDNEFAIYTDDQKAKAKYIVMCMRLLLIELDRSQ